LQNWGISLCNSGEFLIATLGISIMQKTVLREVPVPYNTLFEGKKSALRPDNSYSMNVNNVDSTG